MWEEGQDCEKSHILRDVPISYGLTLISRSDKLPIMKVKGNIIKARVAFVREHFGEDGWNKVLQALPDEDRRIVGGIITNVGWYPFKVAEKLDNTIVSTLAHGKNEVFEDIGRASAKENLTGVHKDFVESRDPQTFLKQTPLIYRFYYDTGRRTYEPTGPNSGVIITYDAETYSTIDCLTVIGWYKEALEMCGAHNVTIQEENCRARGDNECRYRVSWD